MRALLVAVVLVAAPLALRAADTTRTAARDTGVFHMARSPLAATLMSAVVPGSGQIYNGQWWKAPVIWAVGGFLLYKVIDDNRLFLDAQDKYFNSPDTTIRKSPSYFALKEQYRDDRDYYGAFLFLLYALNVADAFVGAHLFDFPVENGLVERVDLRPRLGRAGDIGVGVGIRLR